MKTESRCVFVNQTKPNKSGLRSSLPRSCSYFFFFKKDELSSPHCAACVTHTSRAARLLHFCALGLLWSWCDGLSRSAERESGGLASCKDQHRGMKLNGVMHVIRSDPIDRAVDQAARSFAGLILISCTPSKLTSLTDTGADSKPFSVLSRWEERVYFV